jgi:hypothetical protein
MRDLALRAAGTLAIVVAVIHGALGELRVFARAHVEPQPARRLLRLIWQASTIDWIGIGVLLIVAPSLHSAPARGWVVAVAVVVYAYAAIGNALATRAPHPGWILMLCVIGLALLGL